MLTPQTGALSTAHTYTCTAVVSAHNETCRLNTHGQVAKGDHPHPGRATPQARDTTLLPKNLMACLVGMK